MRALPVQKSTLEYFAGLSTRRDLNTLVLDIVARSLPLLQRTNLEKHQHNADAGLVKQRIQNWQHNLCSGNFDKFSNRLQRDALPLQSILLPIKISSISTLPPWACLLEAILRDAINNTEEEFTVACASYPEIENSLKKLFIPFVRIATERLRRHVQIGDKLLPETVLHTFELQLLDILYQIARQTINLEFAVFRSVARMTHESNHAAFIDQMIFGKKILKFFEEYCVLARLLATATQQWIAATDEFIHRLRADWATLENI